VLELEAQSPVKDDLPELLVLLAGHELVEQEALLVC